MSAAEALADGASILVRLVNETYDSHDSNNTTHTEHHSEVHGEHNSVGTDVLIAIIIFLLLGTFVRSFIRTTEIPVPYTVCLLIISFIWGLLFEKVQNLHESFSWSPLGAFEYLANGTQVLIGIDPHLFLMVFIPPLIFESAFSVNYHTFTMVANQALILAGPGVLISALLTAGLSMLLFGWNFSQSLMFGAIISATDPVAVVALLRDLGASKKLATLIEGESLLNDGTAVVLYFIIQGVVMLGEVPSVFQIFWEFIYRAIGGCVWGIVAGWVVGQWLGRIHDDFLIETSLTFAGAIWCFWGGYWMGVSDILSIVAFGLYLCKNQTLISPRSQHALHYIWEWLAYVANTLIFELTGIIVAVGVKKTLDWNDLWKNMLLYLGLNVIRLIVFVVCYPALVRTGYGISIHDIIIQVVGALRGAIGLAVAMLTVLEVDIQAHGNHELELLAGKIMLHTSLIVVWTLLINAVIMPYIVKHLEMDKLTEEGQVIFHQVIQRLQIEENNLLASMKCDHMYSATDWDKIKSIMPNFAILKQSVFRKDTRLVSMFHKPTTLKKVQIDSSVQIRSSKASMKNARQSVFHKQLERNQINMVGESYEQSLTVNHTHRYSMELAKYITMCDKSSLIVEVRQRVLATVRASYWHQFHEGMITEETTRLLVESAEVAMDKGSLEAQWKHIEGAIVMPEWVARLHARNIPFLNYFVRWYLTEKLNIGIQLCEAFIESYEKVRTMFETFPEFADLDLAQDVVKEGIKIDEIAKLALLNLKVCYSDVYRAIKTYQAATFILNQQIKTVNNLHNAGVMEDKEHTKVLGYIEKHAFACRKIYQSANICSTKNLALQVFKNLPWFNHLDEDLSSELFQRCELITKNENTRLYHEGDKMENIYIVVDGVLHFKHANKEREDESGAIIETRECGQFMGLIAVLGSDTIHCDIWTGSDTVLIRIPKNIIETMIVDEVCFQGMCHAAADVLIKSYFKDAFKHETSVEVNYRVQTGRLIEVDASCARVHLKSEALLLKGGGSEIKYGEELGNAMGDDLICAPTLILPNTHGYEFFEGAVIIELASNDELHGANVEIDHLNEQNQLPEHIKEPENLDLEKISSETGHSDAHPSKMTKEQVQTATLMQKHTRSMLQLGVANRRSNQKRFRMSYSANSFNSRRRIKNKKSVITSNMFKKSRNEKFGRVSVVDVILEESDEEQLSGPKDLLEQNKIQEEKISVSQMNEGKI